MRIGDEGNKRGAGFSSAGLSQNGPVSVPWKAIHVNVQSLPNKIALLEVISRTEGNKFFVITEHHMKTEQASVTALPGYQMVTAYCRPNHAGGGVAIYCDGMSRDVKPIDLTEISCEFSFECVGVTLKIFGKKTALVGVYRSNNVRFSSMSVFLERFYELLNLVNRTHQFVIVTGDLNVNYLKDSLEKKKLVDLISSFGLRSILPVEPTRIMSDNEPSALDYVITNADFLAAINTLSQIADHRSQIISAHPRFLMGTLKQVKSYICRRSFGPGNLSNLKLLLSNNVVDDFFTSDVDVAYTQFWSHFSYYLGISCPVRRVRSSRDASKAWVNCDIVRESQELRDLFWFAKTVNTPEANVCYRSAKKTFSERVKVAKRQYMQDKISGSGNYCKTVWQVVNQNLGRVKQANSLVTLNTGDAVYRDPVEVANVFCKFFATSIEDLLLANLPQREDCTVPSSNTSSIFMGPITEVEMFTALKQIKNKKACCGADDVPLFVLEYLWDCVRTPLCHIFNLSLETGRFPHDLKLGFVLPLLKKGDPELPSNYRPITGLPSISKIFEKVIVSRLNSFMDRYSLLSPCQHGFRRGFSTETAAYDLVQFIYESLDAGCLALTLFFDLTQAFDCVDGEFLVRKLYSMGIRGNLSEWLRSFLSDRRVVVRVGDGQSSQQCLRHGVPQGGILSPTLFVLFINDLKEHLCTDPGVSSQLTLYADDTTISISAKTAKELEEGSNDLIKSFHNWCDKNRLVVNATKSHYLVFHKKRIVPNLKLMLGPNQIKRLDACVFLGLRMDEKLTWQGHSDFVAGKLKSAFFAILNLRHILDTKQLLNTYYALAHSHIKYMILFWGQCTAAELERVLIAQKRILRCIYGVKPLDSCRPVFVEHGILTVPCVLLFESLIYCRKNMSKFPTVSLLHGHNTRSQGDILVSRYNLTLYTKSPYCFCAEAYNHLPESIRSVSEFNMFRKQLRSLLVESCFYSIREYFDAVF